MFEILKFWFATDYVSNWLSESIDSEDAFT